MTRPLHRWKSFWLGVLVLSFLGWAWHDSLTVRSYAEWKQMNAVSGGGGVSVRRNTNLSVEPGGGRRAIDRFSPVAFERLVFARGGAVPKSEWKKSPRPLSYSESYLSTLRFSPRDCWVIFIPHWLVLLAFAIPWAAFLAWRWRGMRRANPRGH